MHKIILSINNYNCNLKTYYIYVIFKVKRSFWREVCLFLQDVIHAKIFITKSLTSTHISNYYLISPRFMFFRSAIQLFGSARSARIFRTKYSSVRKTHIKVAGTNNLYLRVELCKFFLLFKCQELQKICFPI